MKAPFAIRLAVLADLDRILEIEDASFGPEGYDRKLFAFYLSSCPGLFLVACHQGVVGYMITRVRGHRSGPGAELVSVAVDPTLRQAGVASALLESTLRRLRRGGATRLHLVVRLANHAARAFYKKYGFRPLRVLRGYYEDGGDGMAMTRPVSLPRSQ